MVSQKVEKSVNASEAKQSPLRRRADYWGLLRRLTPRNDNQGDFLRPHQLPHQLISSTRLGEKPGKIAARYDENPAGLQEASRAEKFEETRLAGWFSLLAQRLIDLSS
jgi:hypothetical protein